MAVWQFLLHVLPRKEVYKKFGFIPDKLPVNYEERKQHFQDKEQKFDIDFDYNDVLTKGRSISNGMTMIYVL